MPDIVWKSIVEQVPALALFVVMSVGFVRYLGIYLSKRDEQAHARDSQLIRLVLESQTSVQNQSQLFADRVREHHDIQQQTLDVLKENSQALNNNAHALEEMRRALSEVRASIDAVENRVDSLKACTRKG